MAKHVILEAYSFSPSTRTVTINNKYVRREQLVLITNVTTNTVIYNFADGSLGASSYTATTSNNIETTTVVLEYDTTSMNSTDKISILVDETNETFQPAETYSDPVQKLRVSTPQALIDTDFEYGTQPTKWETISLLNNRSSAFYDVTAPNLTVTAIAGAGTRIVTISLTNTTGITTTTPIFIQDTTNPDANGWFIPLTVTLNTSITYYANATIPAASIYDASKTYVFPGVFYTGSSIPVSAVAGAAFTNVGTLVTCTTTNNHGLTVGDGILINGTTAVTSNPPNGTWIVKTTPTSNTFTFDVVTAPVGTITALATSLSPRTYGNSIHRPFDGGVNFTTGIPYPGNQVVRQTRRYFRYQSGKGMQFSTGSNLCPLFFVDTLTSSGTTVTVSTKFAHNMGVGAVIQVSGATEVDYNGIFTITSVPTSLTFTYTALNAPSASPASGFPISVGPKTWYGASARVGMFDSQNGFFFEYDGQSLYAVQRRSTDQLTGYISSLASGGSVATGTNTRWASQLIPGDFIVIRGMSYVVQSIISNTSMVLSPEYRGVTITGAAQVQVTKTVNTKVPQSQWNIDKLDGTGASGYNLDITKMQMWYIDYAWYGAGAIRFGVKDQRGEVKYCHRMPNANVKTEAYMRSGNLPARYEVNTLSPYSIITSTLSSSETGTINVASTAGFPTAGTLFLTASGATGVAIEYVNYTGKTSTTFTGLTRGVTNLSGPGGLTGGGGAVATTFTYSATAPVQVALYAPQCGINIGHWGSSVIMDGRYDDDKSIQFNYGMNTPVTYTSAATRYPVFSIRLAPSVDSGLTGLLGVREIVNRMQLNPASMGIYTTTAGVRVEIILNGRLSAGTFAAVGGSSLAQFALHANTTTISGGESIFTFFCPPAASSTQDLSKIRDLGNSVLGGGNTLTVPNTDLNKYPDGPDILTVCVTPISANAAVTARISWTEAQA